MHVKLWHFSSAAWGLLVFAGPLSIFLLDLFMDPVNLDLTQLVKDSQGLFITHITTEPVSENIALLPADNCHSALTSAAVVGEKGNVSVVMENAAELKDVVLDNPLESKTFIPSWLKWALCGGVILAIGLLMISSFSPDTAAASALASADNPGGRFDAIYEAHRQWNAAQGVGQSIVVPRILPTFTQQVAAAVTTDFLLNAFEGNGIDYSELSRLNKQSAGIVKQCIVHREVLGPSFMAYFDQTELEQFAKNFNYLARLTPQQWQEHLSYYSTDTYIEPLKTLMEAHKNFHRCFTAATNAEITVYPIALNELAASWLNLVKSSNIYTSIVLTHK